MPVDNLLNPATNGVALLIIDMQRDFVLPDSPLRVAGAAATVPTVRRLLEEARSAHWPVFHVVREHKPDGSDVELFRRHLFHEGKGLCVASSPGSAIVDELAPLPGERRLMKTRFSGFYKTALEAQLRALGVHTVVLAGTQYPNCIRGTALDAMYRDFYVVVVTDACSADTADIAEANIRDMRAMGIICEPLARLGSVFAAPLCAQGSPGQPA